MTNARAVSGGRCSPLACSHSGTLALIATGSSLIEEPNVVIAKPAQEGEAPLVPRSW